MENKTGSSTTTYKMRLVCKHMDWLIKTKAKYNAVVKFYYDIIINDKSLLELSNQNALRALEKKTIVSRDGVPPRLPLPDTSIPMYFRRSAINAAVGLARSYFSLMQKWGEEKAEAEEKGKTFKRKAPNPSRKFNFSPVYYKGMYKEFDNESIVLKLWNGTSWVWVKHRFFGRKINSDAEKLSPTIVLQKKYATLNVPVKQLVYDLRSVRERVKNRERFCSVAFSGSDILAACTLHDSDGRVIDSYFIRGGREFMHRRKHLLGVIERNKKQAGYDIYGMKGNDHLWKKIKNYNEYFAHRASRRIIDYCLQNNVKIIVLPKSNDVYIYKPYMEYSGFDFLGNRIQKYLSYKAWQNGIVVTTVRANYSSNKCYHCREYIKKYNEGESPSRYHYGGKNFVCPNGHRGSSVLNMSKNLGSYFLKKFPREIA